MRQAIGRQIAREYWAEMIRLVVAPMNRAIREELVAQLEGLESLARGELGIDSMRHDVGDLVEGILDGITDRLFETVPDTALRELALRRGTEVSGLNARSLGREFKRVLGIDALMEDPALDRKLDFFAAENVRLIKKMANDHKARVAAITINGLAAGKTASQLGKEIQKASGIPRRRAAFIARDQVASLNGQINRARQTANGVTHFKWRTVGDDRVRDEHEDIEDETFSWATGAPTEGFPGQPPGCRCVAEPVLEEAQLAA